MGLVLLVESILVSAARRRPNGPRLEDINREKQAVIEAILHEFGWQEVPWEEPSDRAGALATSMSHATYSHLTALPFMLDLDDADFPHLLDHDVHWTIYIPHDFETPSSFRRGSIDSFVLASSPRLLAELTRLQAARRDADPDEALDTLRLGARESVDLALPLQIRW